MNYDFFVAHICKDYGWTYQEFLNTPQWFIEAILDKIEVENATIKMKKDGKDTINTRTSHRRSK